MAEDAIDRAAALGGLPTVQCQTAQLKLHGWVEGPRHDCFGFKSWTKKLNGSGSMEPICPHYKNWREDPDLDQPLHPELPFRRSEVIWAARHEMATCVEDVLARRTRSLFLDAKASLEAAPITARLLARELGKDANWELEQPENYRRLAEGYIWN